MPKLETGIVMNIPLAKPKYPLLAAFGLPEMVVDLNVKLNDRIVNYNNIPAQADVADTYSNGENIVITDSRDAMNNEILSYKQKSIDIINSVESHKAIIAGCDELLHSLNPEYAERRQREEEIVSLKQQMAEMSRNMLELLASIKGGEAPKTKTE